MVGRCQLIFGTEAIKRFPNPLELNTFVMCVSKCKNIASTRNESSANDHGINDIMAGSNGTRQRISYEGQGEILIRFIAWVPLNLENLKIFDLYKIMLLWYN